MDDTNIQKSIIGFGLRGDDGPTSKLADVGGGDQQGKHGQLVIVKTHIHRLSLVFEKTADGRRGVWQQPSAIAPFFLEQLAHHGVVADAGGPQKKAPVHLAHIHHSGAPMNDRSTGISQLERNSKFPSHAISRACRHDSQGHIGVHQSADHLVDGAISPHGHHQVEALGNGLAGQGSALSPGALTDDLALEAMIGEDAPQIGDIILGAPASPGYGIDDDSGFHSVVNWKIEEFPSPDPLPNRIEDRGLRIEG